MYNKSKNKLTMGLSTDLLVDYVKYAIVSGFIKVRNIMDYNKFIKSKSKINNLLKRYENIDNNRVNQLIDIFSRSIEKNNCRRSIRIYKEIDKEIKKHMSKSEYIEYKKNIDFISYGAEEELAYFRNRDCKFGLWDRGFNGIYLKN